MMIRLAHHQEGYSVRIEFPDHHAEALAERFIFDKSVVHLHGEARPGAKWITMAHAPKVKGKKNG